MTRAARVAVLVVLLLAAVVRFAGITHRVETDENKLVAPSATMKIRDVHRPLLPGGARYPHLGYYLLGGTYWTLANLRGAPVDHTLVGRVFTVLVSVLTVAVTMAVGTRLGGWRLGVLAGLFLAVFPLGVKYAHYAHVDTLAAVFMIAAVGAAARLWETGLARWYGAVGLCAGLAFASQYYGVTIGVVLPLAHLGWALRQARRWRALSRPALLGGLLVIPVVFFLTNPWKFIAPQEAIASYRGLALRAQGGDLGYTSPHLLWPLLTRSPDWGLPFTVSGLVWEVTAPLSFLALVGLLAAARRRDRRFLVLVGVVGAVLYLAIVGYVRMHAVKRFIGVLPLVALAVAYGAVHGPSLLTHWPRAARMGALLLVAGGVGTALWQVAGFDLAYARDATLPAAEAWAEAHLPAGSVVLQHGPLRLLDPRTTRHTVVTLQEEYANIGGRHDTRVRDHRARPLAAWLERRVEYVVLDSRLVDRYDEPTATRMYPAMTASYRAFYGDIRARGVLVYRVRPEPRRRAGPRIEIYDVRALRTEAGGT